MKLVTILRINTVIIVLALLAHLPLAIMAALRVKGFEAVDVAGPVSMAIVDTLLLASCIVGFVNKEARLRVITVHAGVIALLAVSIIIMVVNIALFGPPEGNYSFGLGLTTALCAYSVYLARRVFIEYKGGVMGNYHWFAAFIVGIAELAMFSRLFGELYST